MTTYYREAECDHAGWHATEEGPACLDCGGVQHYVVPVTIDRLAVRDTIIECDGMGYDIVTDRIMELFVAVGEEGRTMTQLGDLVSRGNAQAGGDCPECGMAIGVGNPIFKYWLHGQATGLDGSGPGVWVCSWCHDRQRFAAKINDEPSEVDLWECSRCLTMCNPVIITGLHMLCFPCYEASQVHDG